MQMLRHTLYKLSPVFRAGIANTSSPKCKELPLAVARRCLSSGTLEDVIIREATIDDQGEVVALQPHLYEGMDSLNDYFPRYLANHSYKCYVAEMQRKILAYMQYLTIDGGHTAMICKERVKEDAQPPGVGEHLREYIIDKLKSSTPNLENILSVQVLEDVEGIQNTGRRRWMTFQATNLTPIVWSGAKNSQQIGHDKFLDIMSDPETRDQLFPDNNIISFWEVFNTLKGVEANISHILNQSWVYVTYTDNPVNKATIAFSTGTPARCERGLRLDIDFYGDRLVDFESHIVSHCQRAMHYKEHRETLNPVLCFPAILDSNLVQEYCTEKLLWQEGPTIYENKPLYELIKHNGNDPAKIIFN